MSPRKNLKSTTEKFRFDVHWEDSLVTTFQQQSVAKTIPTQLTTMTVFVVANKLIRGPRNSATMSWPTNPPISKKETAFPIVSLSSVHGWLRRIPDSCRKWKQDTIYRMRNFCGQKYLWMHHWIEFSLTPARGWCVCTRADYFMNNIFVVLVKPWKFHIRENFSFCSILIYIITQYAQYATLHEWVSQNFCKNRPQTYSTSLCMLESASRNRFPQFQLAGKLVFERYFAMAPTWYGFCL